MSKPWILLTALLVGVGSLPAQPPSGFKVIVNESNRISTMSKTELSRCFLKEVTRWESGEKVLPVNLTEDSPTREAFSRHVHGRAVAAIEAYWQQKIFTGREVPPPQKRSDPDVVAYVQANPGAIGYVSGSSPVGQARVLRITERSGREP